MLRFDSTMNTTMNVTPTEVPFLSPRVPYQLRAVGAQTLNCRKCKHYCVQIMKANAISIHSIIAGS